MLSVRETDHQLGAEYLREIILYDEKTGKFSWRHKGRKTKPLDQIGSVDAGGYLRIGIKGRRYSAHRLAWLYVHGKWPEQEIDHINGERLDNRIVNLREATISQNRKNRAAGKLNRNRLKGAHFVSRTGKWRSVIVTDGKAHFLGTFGNEEDAHKAYIAAAIKLHGEFARLP